ncbi:protein kinase family protein [Streptomyces vastus]|uniref:protein kinase family protein n=1 Tax=Streptomyces vastus TaxID=285451 RepID=UPI0031DEAC48
MAETESPDRSRGARLAVHSAVSTTLALCSDHRLRELVDAAVPLGSGIGGQSVLMEVAERPVFVKRVPLTDLEALPENVRSTANLFGLPAFCQYGIGAIGHPGFGVWRELAAHIMTTNWVLGDAYQGFPLLYHWRVLPDMSQSLPEELADVDRAVAYWGSGPGIRHRIEALGRSSASVALFLEYIPQNLHTWLAERMRTDDANAACSLVERELEAGVSFMNARGLLHFDAHFQNILTDGRRLYFTDFGLALSSRFELSQSHADFYDRHRVYDRAHTMTWLVNWLLKDLYDYEREEREAAVRASARGERLTGIPGAAAAIIARWAPLAAVVSGFNRTFHEESRETPYPAEEIHRVSEKYGLAFSADSAGTSAETSR